MERHISICLPAYNEEKYLPAALEELSKQTLFDQSWIIVADYDPEQNGATKAVVDSFSDWKNLLYQPVDRAGIAYARHLAINKIPDTYYLVNFDADARYDRDDALELMIGPLEKKEAVITHCENVLDTNDVPAEAGFGFRFINGLQSFLPTVWLEPGTCFTRYAYNLVGGFDDVSWWEGTLLSLKLFGNFGPFLKKWIPNVKIIVSARRVKQYQEEGFAVLDYTNKAYR